MHPIPIVCPLADTSCGEVEITTRMWRRHSTPSSSALGGGVISYHGQSQLILDFIAKETGRFVAKWEKVPRYYAANSLLGKQPPDEECKHDCVELKPQCTDLSGGECGSTVSPCEDGGPGSNGVGADQQRLCNTKYQMPWLYVGLGVGCGVFFIVILIGSFIQRHRETKTKKGNPVPTEDYCLDGKESEC
jgi:hypothetical protein